MKIRKLILFAIGIFIGIAMIGLDIHLNLTIIGGIFIGLGVILFVKEFSSAHNT